MKILIARMYCTYISIENSTYNVQEIGLAKALSRKGHEVGILFWTNVKEEDKYIEVTGGLPIRVYYRHGYNILKNCIYKNASSIFDKYDIVQGAEYNQLYSAYLARKLKNKYVVYHGPYYSKFNWQMNLLTRLFDPYLRSSFLKNKTVFMAKSPLAKDYLLSKKIGSNNIRNVGVGLDFEQLNSKEEELLSVELQSVLYKNEDGIKLLYVGRLEPRRNILFLYNILAVLMKMVKKVTLYQVGYGRKKYIKKCNQYAKKLGLDDIIVRIPKIPHAQLHHLYKKAEFFMFPTLYDIFGMVIMEAMYNELVVVSSLNGGSLTLIDNPDYGRTLDNEPPEVWAATILKLHKSSEYAKIQKGAKSMLEKCFNWDHLSNSILESYNLSLYRK
jgi:glycosyltransferase involved in cell wall biosynthesis